MDIHVFKVPSYKMQNAKGSFPRGSQKYVLSSYHIYIHAWSHECHSLLETRVIHVIKWSIGYMSDTCEIMVYCIHLNTFNKYEGTSKLIQINTFEARFKDNTFVTLN